MEQFKADFFNSVSIELHRLTKIYSDNKGDIIQIPDLLERGKNFIMSWLKDAQLKEAFKNDAQLYYYNIACIAFCGGIAYADAWDKDITQIKTGAS